MTTFGEIVYAVKVFFILIPLAVLAWLIIAARFRPLTRS